jgi:iron(III) transport system permease protein
MIATTQTGPLQQRRFRFSTLLPVAISLVVALPLLTIIVLAVLAGPNSAGALGVQQLITLALNTGALCLVAAVLALTLGTLSAWFVAAYDFPGRNLLSWMALLPLAMPGYIISFVFVDFLDYAGPLQTWLRQATGWNTPADYVFPEIRSVGGAAITFALVLYPYVYLAGRTAFARMPASQIMAARTLGHGPVKTLFTVVLPQARPALAIGTGLVIMECLNDIGSVSFFGVRTFALAIFTTWLDQGSLGGAAQLALLMLTVIAALVYAEHYARSKDRLPKLSHQMQRDRLLGVKGVAATIAVSLPILLGFVVPVVLLVLHGLRRFDEATSAAFASALFHTLALAAGAAVIILMLALILNYRSATSWRIVPRFLADMGYAIPGTILAIGVIVPLSLFDHGFNQLTQSVFEWTPGLILSGSIFALLFAYVTRFLVIASGMVETGLDKIPQSLGHAASTLGRTPFRVFMEIKLPLLKPALLAAGLLVLVDAMKELPATLLLRPFDYETLATLTFASASLGLIEQAAWPALAIVAVGLIPIYILMASLNDQ